MKKFYSPINALAEQMTRPKGTGAEFMTELSKKPGFKQAEVEDRDLQTLQSLPKMAREEFLRNLKAKRSLQPDQDIRHGEEAHHEEYTLPGGTNYREILLQHPEGQFPGVSGHFGGAPNILASIRAKDRVSPEGKKILHIEEIQSDWHTKGRKHGYASSGEDTYAAAKKAEREYNALKAKRMEASGNYTALEKRHKEAITDFQRDMNKRMMDKYATDIMGLTPQVMKAEEAHRVAEERMRKAVPDAPFKKNWHELALKRMIQHAAEKGYHEIHITPGETQAERWGAKDEGAKGFHDLYNKQIPQFLNKFGKQFGAQVGKTAFTHPGNQKQDASDDELLGQLGVEAPLAQTPQMHSFPITSEMREHVLKNGMPLYAEGGKVHGIIKERVTVSPNMDAMQYEIIKKAKQ